MQQRKQKKQRLADAMERRRCRLLREGVTQWLLVADDLRDMRMKFAAQQQAKVILTSLKVSYEASSRREMNKC